MFCLCESYEKQPNSGHSKFADALILRITKDGRRSTTVLQVIQSTRHTHCFGGIIQVGYGMSRDFCHKKCMGRGQPRDCAMKKWRLFDRGQRLFLWAERRAGLSSACLNTGCETCAHARGCEQLLLSSIFRFRCLALSSSVFLASNCEKCWGR